MKNYTVALIGCGEMGKSHIEKISVEKNIFFKYVCDTNIKKANEFKDKYKAEIATDNPLDCIMDKDTDIVIISSYPSSHFKLIKLCVKNEKHVLCEKPITANLKDAKKAIRIIDNHPNTKVLIGYILRHNSTFIKVADMIHEGKIGSPIAMRIVINHRAKDMERYKALIKDTSPIIDCGVHYTDLMRWFSGEEITNITASGISTDSDVPKGNYNCGTLLAKLSGGSMGMYEVCWSKTANNNFTKEISGPLGNIKITYAQNRNTGSEKGDLIEYYNSQNKITEEINNISDIRPCKEQFDYLIKMIETNKPASPTTKDVIKSFKAVAKADKIIRKTL